MKFSIDLYRILQKKLDDIEEDCGLFDMDDNIEAGIRVRVRLRKLKRKIDAMIHKTLKMSDDIKRSRGKKTSADYWAEWKRDGRAKKYIAERNERKMLRKEKENRKKNAKKNKA